MIEMRYSDEFVYVFEGRRPGEIAHTMPAYEVQILPGKWELCAPFNPAPGDPLLSMGRRWLASAIEPSKEVPQAWNVTVDQIAARTQRAEKVLQGIVEMKGAPDPESALDTAVKAAEVTLEAVK